MKPPIIMNVQSVRVSIFCLFLSCSGSEGVIFCSIGGCSTSGAAEETSNLEASTGGGTGIDPGSGSGKKDLDLNASTGSIVCTGAESVACPIEAGEVSSTGFNTGSGRASFVVSFREESSFLEDGSTESEDEIGMTAGTPFALGFFAVCWSNFC